MRLTAGVDQDGSVYITVHGTPAPQGSKSFKGLTPQGKPMLVESSLKVKPWREAVKLAALAALPRSWQPLDEPLHVGIEFYLKRPTSSPKTLGYPMRKPDIEKLERSTYDALTDAGVWADDARVVSNHNLKLFAGPGADVLHTPGAYIVITPMALT
jgi:Holliday junction resolvase RusA-like endonuclease